MILQTRFHLIMADPCMTEVAIHGWLSVFANPQRFFEVFWTSEKGGFGGDLGVSKNKCTPKWMVYNGHVTPLLKFMIWGAHPYI